MTAAPTGNTAAIIDLAAGLDRVMGDTAMFLRLLARFAGDYRNLTTRLHAALDVGDAVLAQRIAHTLKGAAGMLEARHLRGLALDVELALKSGGAAPTALIDALDAELARVLVEVDALLAASDAPQSAVALAALPVDARDVARLRAMLDVGDGGAPELVALLRPRLLVTLGSERMAALDSAVRRFDFEHALVLLGYVGDAPATGINV
ncbi:Hpt domain-containing protein [Massilia aurea]|uniref:Hpt domain-containing protein n=1 Tax=Massilia aurea TaxID=373040 RepID=UPI003463322D